MSYEPTQWAAQPPEQQPSQGQPPAQPPAGTPPPYGQPPAYNQSNPGWLPTQQGSPQLPAYNQSNPGWLPTQQASQPPAYNQSNPGWPSAPQAPIQQPGATPPAYGQSNPSLPPYNQFAAQPAADPYAPAPGQPYQPGMLPPYQPAVPPQKKSNLKIFLIVAIIIVLVLGGGGTILYIVSRPQPVISSVTSKYSVGALPAGTSSTTFTVTGKGFSGNSAITFLLDNAPMPGAPNVQSDSNGNVTATLTVTNAWAVGNHTITAKDAGGYLTKTGKQIAIVTQGQAGTPGPNGAPTDSASGTIDGTVSAGSSSGELTLTVTGSPTGGKVCRDEDDGQPHTHTGTASGVGFSETTIRTCSGTYKGGKLSYTETVTSDKIAFDNGLSCTVQVPYVSARMEGTFTDGTNISGSYAEDTVTVNCNSGVGSQTITGNTGTWDGIASMH